MCGVPIMQRAACEYEEGTPLPWSHISAGVSEEFLREEHARARVGEVTPDCSFTSCSQCGVCPLVGMTNVIEGTRTLRGECA